MKLFFDINVILDVLANREPFAEDAAKLLSLVDKGNGRDFTRSSVEIRSPAEMLAAFNR